jgi:hypothetical protein
MNTRNLRIVAVGVGLALVSATGAGVASGQESTHDMESMAGHSHEMSEMHGGSVTMTPMHHFETLFTHEGVCLYAYDAKQKPILNPKQAKATVMLATKEGKPMEMAMQYVPPDSAKGKAQGYFMAKHDFAQVEKGSMKATFHIQGMAEKPIEFKTAVSVTEPAVYACPMHPKMTAADPMRCPTCGMTMKKVGADKEMHGHMEESDHGHH